VRTKAKHNKEETAKEPALGELIEQVQKQQEEIAQLYQQIVELRKAIRRNLDEE